MRSLGVNYRSQRQTIIRFPYRRQSILRSHRIHSTVFNGNCMKGRCWSTHSISSSRRENRRPQLRLRPIWQTPLLAVSRSRAGLSTFRGTSRSLPMSRRRTGSTAKPARALICMHQRGIRRQGIPSLDSPMSGITLCLLGILREKSTACTRLSLMRKSTACV